MDIPPLYDSFCFAAFSTCGGTCKTQQSVLSRPASAVSRSGFLPITSMMCFAFSKSPAPRRFKHLEGVAGQRRLADFATQLRELCNNICIAHVVIDQTLVDAVQNGFGKLVHLCVRAWFSLSCSQRCSGSRWTNSPLPTASPFPSAEPPPC